MCTFILKLRLCPCKQVKPPCVRFETPIQYAVSIRGDKRVASHHALDLADGVGLKMEYACSSWKSEHGEDAEPCMACPNTVITPEPVVADKFGRIDESYLDSELCRTCLAHCVQPC